MASSKDVRVAYFFKNSNLQSSNFDDLSSMSADELILFNPKLANYIPAVRLAYAKFKMLGQKAKLKRDLQNRFDLQ